MVQPAEQAHGQVPAVVGRDPAHERLRRQPAAEVGVQLRAAALAGLGLAQEALGEPVVQAASASAAFACSAMPANAAGSLTARSASTLRSSSIPAFLQPATNWL